MKKLILIFISLLSLYGCVGARKEVSSIDLNNEAVVGVGGILFQYEFVAFPAIDSYRFDLTVAQLTDQNIALIYTEYSYKSTNLNNTLNWKEGPNKRFDYAIADKIIRFKSYEFEIVSVEKGQVKYKRIK